jgi:hypothetical protein
MQIRHELKRGKFSPKVTGLSGSTTQTERQLNTGLHYSKWGEDTVDAPDWEVSAADLDEYVDIWSRG